MDKDVLKKAKIAKPNIFYFGDIDKTKQEEAMKADPDMLYIGKSEDGAIDLSQVEFGEVVVETVHTFSAVVAISVASYVSNLRKFDPVKAAWAKKVLAKDYRATLPRGFPAYTPFKMPQ